MPKLNGRPPKYRHHRSTGRAYVEFDGRPIYVGRHNTPESWERYHRLINEWLASGGVLRPSLAAGNETDGHGIHVRALVLAYWRHAKTYYRKPDGSPTSEVNTLKQALRVVRRLYGRSTASEFGPKRLKAVREAMVAKVSETRLLFIMTALKSLLRDEHFVTVLRAEGLDTLPQPLAEQVNGRESRDG